MAVKLKDIAKATGYSLSTVSKALRESPEISPEASLSINRAAVAMGYRTGPQPNANEKIVGVILPEINSHYYAELTHELSEELSAKGYTMMLMLGSFYLEGADGLFHTYRRMLNQNVCGIILSSMEESLVGLRELIASSSIPLVVISEVMIPRASEDTVIIDCNSCVGIALNHLLEMGHTKIGYIGDREADIRYNTLITSMHERGVAVNEHYFKCGDERFEMGGYLRMKDILASEDRPTAVIAAYDQFAFGALSALREAGLQVPHDMSIVGIDNVVMGRFNSVPLTSVMKPTKQMAQITVKLLLDKMKNPNNHVVQNVALQCKLIQRSSVARIHE